MLSLFSLLTTTTMVSAGMVQLVDNAEVQLSKKYTQEEMEVIRKYGEDPVCSTAQEGSVPRVTYIDQNTKTGNFLFRGGSPDIDSNYGFDYNALYSSIQDAAQTAKVTLPSKFVIADIDLMHFNQKIKSDTDSREGVNEYNYFYENPSAGEFIHWHTSGTSVNALDDGMTTNNLRGFLASTVPQWLHDILPQRMDWIANLMNTTYDSPTVFFWHCDCGCDRTGETSMAYYMKYLNMTWKDANDLNTQIIGYRPMNCPNYRSAQWMCLWLNSEMGYDLDCLDQQPCS